jgi:hypothetical protein
MRAKRIWLGVVIVVVIYGLTKWALLYFGFHWAGHM